MAGRRRGGKGSKEVRDYRGEGGRNGLQDALVYFRPPDERKNPDWSDFVNYSIRRSDWPATCHSRELVFSHSLFIHSMYKKTT